MLVSVACHMLLRQLLRCWYSLLYWLTAIWLRFDCVICGLLPRLCVLAHFGSSAASVSSVCFFFNLLLCTPCRHLPKINNFCVRSFLSGAFISIFVVIFSFIIILLAHFCWSLHTRTRAQYFAHGLYSFIPFAVYRRKAIKINIKKKLVSVSYSHLVKSIHLCILKNMHQSFLHSAILRPAMLLNDITISVSSLFCLLLHHICLSINSTLFLRIPSSTTSSTVLLYPHSITLGSTILRSFRNLYIRLTVDL